MKLICLYDTYNEWLFYHCSKCYLNNNTYIYIYIS